MIKKANKSFSRWFIHIPHGLLMGIPIVGLPFLLLFIRYEENEDRHIKDQAWLDYRSALIGVAVTEMVFLVLAIWRYA